MPARTTLRDLLLEEGLCDPAAVEALERAALRRGSAFVAALLEGGLIAPAEVLELLRRRLQLSEVDLERTVVEPDAIRDVPLALAEHHLLQPLRIERRGGRPVIWVAMADPLDARAIEEIEFATGCRVEPAVALATAVAAAIKRNYRGVVTKLIRDGVPSPGADSRSAEPSLVEPAADGPSLASLHTQPVHRLEDEASVEFRVRALVNALARRGLLSEEEYLRELSELLKAGVAHDE